MKKAKIKAPSSKQTRVSSTRVARLALGGYLMIFLLGQLFTFEKFPALLQAIGLSAPLAVVIAAVLVGVELLAMPFLIGLDVRRWVYRLSRMCCFMALVLLSVIEVVAFMSETSVLFGATFDLPGGLWSLSLLLALWALLVWSSDIFQRWDRPVTFSFGRRKL